MLIGCKVGCNPKLQDFIRKLRNCWLPYNSFQRQMLTHGKYMVSWTQTNDLVSFQWFEFFTYGTLCTHKLSAPTYTLVHRIDSLKMHHKWIHEWYGILRASYTVCDWIWQHSWFQLIPLFVRTIPMTLYNFYSK